MTAGLASTVRIHARPRITCPHCWHNFPTEEVLWVAEHEDLRGDAWLDTEYEQAKQRFLPSRFNVEGNALDSRGMTCQTLACPGCHLPLPRALVDITPLFVSILGIPSCGKSYFLASMTWRLRKVLPQSFRVAFTDADPESNAILNDYEQQQFFDSQQQTPVKLAKTDVHGSWYNSVKRGTQSIQYAKPFLFNLIPAPGHPRFEQGREAARCLCMYDNAGESFLPGSDKAGSPVTRHLSHSQALFYLFDPTKEPRFRAASVGKSHDPQMQANQQQFRQDLVLHEAAKRIRQFTGLKHDERHNRPLVVVITKYDAWSHLFPGLREINPIRHVNTQGLCALEWEKVQKVSDRMRVLLWELAPELVSGAEGFAQEVIYIPVSATGCAPDANHHTRPCDIQPCWVEVPMLAMLARWSKNLIPYMATVKK